MLFWQAYLAVHAHFIFKALVDLMVERHQVSGKQDCWFQLAKKSQSAADAFAQVCGSTAGTGTPVYSDHVTGFAHIK